jgi:hypothetical protein
MKIRFNRSVQNHCNGKLICEVKEGDIFDLRQINENTYYYYNIDGSIGYVYKEWADVIDG